MKSKLLSIILVVLAICAVVIIGTSGIFLEENNETLNVNIMYLACFFIALIYLNWWLNRFLSPLQNLPKEQREHIKQLSHRNYKKSFFAGTIGFGYFLGILFAFDILRDLDTGTNYALGAVFFIIAGTVVKARELTAILVEQLINQKTIE